MYVALELSILRAKSWNKQTLTSVSLEDKEALKLAPLLPNRNAFPLGTN